MRLERNLARVREQIRDSARKSGREPSEITLVVVVKTVAAEVVSLLSRVGVVEVGENRVQPAEDKVARVPASLRWHMIGPLQRNKVRRALSIFSLFHSVESERMLATMDRVAGEEGRVARVLLQVNISDEAQKHGVPPGGLCEILNAAREFGGVEVVGLMGMGPYVADPEETRPLFRTLAELLADANRHGWYREPLTELSMGMTNDYPVAVEEGATLVRVGTAIFDGVRLTSESGGT